MINESKVGRLKLKSTSRPMLSFQLESKLSFAALKPISLLRACTAELSTVSVPNTGMKRLKIPKPKPIPVSDLLDSSREPSAADVLLICACAIPAKAFSPTSRSSSSPTAMLNDCVALRPFGSEAVIVTLVEPRVNGDISTSASVRLTVAALPVVSIV